MKKICLLFLITILSFTTISINPQTGKKQISKKKAILLGINKYSESSINALEFAVSDSLKMKSLLKAEYDVYLLNDDSSPEYKPTQDNFERIWKEVINSSPDQILFYFSGHGYIDIKHANSNSLVLQDSKVKKDGDGLSGLDESSKKDTTLHLENLVADLKEKGIDKAVFVIDACRSDLPVLKGEKSIGTAGLGDFNKLVEDASGIVILNATQSKRPSYEYPSQEGGGGLFTHYLEDALSGELQNESLEEFVTVGKLFDFVSDKMKTASVNIQKKESERQVPDMAIAKDDRAKNLPILTMRPAGKDRSEFYSFRNILGEEVRSKVIYDPETGERKRVSFFQEVLQEEKGDKRIYELKSRDLDGVAALEYEFEPNLFFSAKQKKLNAGEPEFTSGLVFKDEKSEEGAGWHYAAPISEFPILTHGKDAKKEPVKFRKEVYDFNGNLLREETFAKEDKLQKDETKEIARTVRAYDIGGQKTLEEYYDEKNTLINDKDGIARYIYAYDTNKNLLSEEYYTMTSDGKLQLAKNKEGFASVKYLYQQFKEKDSGKEKSIWKLKERQYRDENSDLTGELGTLLSIIRYEYDSKGNLLSEEFLNKEKKPIDVIVEVTPEGKVLEGKLKEIGISIDPKESSKKGLLLKRRHPMDQDILSIDSMRNKTSIEKENLSIRMSRREWSFNEKGNVTSLTFFRVGIGEEKRKKFFLPGGIAEIKYEYDEKNNLIKIAYFGESGSAVADENGHSVWKRDFDLACIASLGETQKRELTEGEKNTCTKELAFYHAGYDEKEPNKALVEDQFGIGRYLFTYDKYANLISEEFFDGNGNLKENTEYATPVAKQIRRFNESCMELYNKGEIHETLTCLELLELYDKDGKLKNDKDGVASYQNTFNDKGLLTTEAFFDLEEKQTVHKEKKYASKEILYESILNETTKQIIWTAHWKDIDKKELLGDLDKKIIQKFPKSDTELVLEHSFYTKDKKPVTPKDSQVHSTLQSFDKQGKLIEKTTIGVDEKPILIDGFATVKYKHPSFKKGNSENFLESVSYFGANQEKIEKDKIHLTLKAYDADSGKIAREEFQDKDGKPVKVNDFAIREVKYKLGPRIDKTGIVKDPYFISKETKMDEIGIFRTEVYTDKTKDKESILSSLLERTNEDSKVFMRTNYDSKSRPIEIRYENNTGQLILGPEKTYSYKKMEYPLESDSKEISKAEFFDEKDKPALGEDKYFTYKKGEFHYKDSGWKCKEESRSLPDGSYVPDAEGIGNKKECYNKDNVLVLKVWNGKNNGELKSYNSDGVARYEKVIKSDENGTSTKEIFTGENKTPISRSLTENVAIVLEELSKDKNTFVKSFQDEKGQPAMSSDGFSKLVQKYKDEFGKKRIIEESIYDTKGALVESFNGIATWKNEYSLVIPDTSKFEEEISMLGKSEILKQLVCGYNKMGELVSGEETIPCTLFEYQRKKDKEILVAESYLSKPNTDSAKDSETKQEPRKIISKGLVATSDSFNVHKYFKQYDDKDRVTLEFTYNKDETLEPDFSGIAKKEYGYFSDSNDPIKEIQFNADGMPMSHTEYFPPKMKDKDELATEKDSKSKEKAIKYFASYRKLSEEDKKKLLESEALKEKANDPSFRLLSYSLIKREKFLEPGKPLIKEELDETGTYTKQEYYQYFQNPRGSFDKRLISLELDRYYRPKKIGFYKEDYSPDGK